MHRIFLMQPSDASTNGDAEAKLDDGGGAQVQGRCEEEGEARRRRVKKKMTLGPIYKVNGEVTGARIKEPENWIYNGAVASIVGGSLTEGEMYHF